MDLSYIYDIADGDKTATLALLRSLQDNLIHLPPLLMLQASTSDYDALKATAHKMKSCVSFTGEERLISLLLELEAARIKNLDATVLTSLVEELIRITESMEITLAKEIAVHQNSSASN
jgi:hypothetical protein